MACTLQRLEELKCDKIGGTQLRHLSSLPRLRVLGARGLRNCAVLTQRCSPPARQGVNLSNSVGLQDADLAWLGKIKHRHVRLELYGCRGSTDAALAHLGGISTLQHLYIGRTATGCNFCALSPTNRLQEFIRRVAIAPRVRRTRDIANRQYGR